MRTVLSGHVTLCLGDLTKAASIFSSVKSLLSLACMAQSQWKEGSVIFYPVES